MALTTLITGASSGFGEQFAHLAAADHCDLVLVARSQHKLEQLAQELTDTYAVRVKTIPQDLSHPQAADQIMNHLEQWKWGVDVLINNAGFGVFGQFSETDWQREQELIMVNILSLTALTKRVLPGMINRRFGRILNVASTAAFLPGPLMSVYYASKAYVLSFSEGIREEVRGTGVTVTTLCPGASKTGFEHAAHAQKSRLFKGKDLPTAREVALFGYQAMKEGKGVVIPGLYNKFTAFAPRLLPRSLVTRLVKRGQAAT